MAERVIALDPGGRSGYASALMDVDSFVLLETGVLRQDKMARWLAEKQGVHAGPKLYGPNGEEEDYRPSFDVIVAESWRPRRKNGKMDWIEGDPLLSAQHVGQIRLIADLSGAKYVEQPPSQKTSYTASMPHKLLRLDVLSNEQHDQDARMHLWGYFKSEWFTATVDPEDTVSV